MSQPNEDEDKLVIAGAVVRNLPTTFHPVQHKLLEDISNAFYNPQIGIKI